MTRWAAILAVLTAFLANPARRASAVDETTVATLEDFRAAMIAIGEAFDIVAELVYEPKFILNSARSEGMTQVRIVQRNLRGVRSFFQDHDKADGVKLVASVLDDLAVLEQELTRATPDRGAAIDAAAEVTSGCVACHAVYREGTKETGFHFRQ